MKVSAVLMLTIATPLVAWGGYSTSDDTMGDPVPVTFSLSDILDAVRTQVMNGIVNGDDDAIAPHPDFVERHIQANTSGYFHQAVRKFSMDVKRLARERHHRLWLKKRDVKISLATSVGVHFSPKDHEITPPASHDLEVQYHHILSLVSYVEKYYMPYSRRFWTVTVWQHILWGFLFPGLRHEPVQTLIWSTIYLASAVIALLVGYFLLCLWMIPLLFMYDLLTESYFFRAVPFTLAFWTNRILTRWESLFEELCAIEHARDVANEAELEKRGMRDCTFPSYTMAGAAVEEDLEAFLEQNVL